MDGVDVIRSAFGGAHFWYEGTVADIGDDEANAVPPGVAPTIGALMAHILHCEDFMFNTVIQGKPTVWERDGWEEKVGVAMQLELDEATRNTYKCDPAKLGQYGKAVFANTDAALGALQESDLDRELELTPYGFPSNMTMGAFLSQMLLGNTYAHTGEISSLKGAGSKRGYAF